MSSEDIDEKAKDLPSGLTKEHIRQQIVGGE
jgi:hypothetical protein